MLPHGELNVDVLKNWVCFNNFKKTNKFFGEKISIIIALASKNVEEHRLAVLDINKYLKNNDFETKLEKIKNYIELIKFLKSLSVEGDSNENSRY
ncbi:PTS sugar transporter subunit IIA [Sneathia vaginalis]|uniref:PTS sugar transporter subunit IIA n=1 Tax=Sneathia vaginalis TaxID=187101 RepID=UPI00254D8403|nr:PTS sugar transporter subunit IIA [Sneathia vaginalis]MDK9581352.1 PTS sugar transporter subunit IIA [Sneathia vaginalis]